MRLVMLGTGPFAVPTFHALLAGEHEIAALVTRPARAVHGKQKQPVQPMRAVAEERGLPVFAPESINSPEGQEILRSLAGDLLVVCDYGQILSSATLALARLGGINLHGSLLPRYRGAAPVNWAVYHGDRETGVTVIHMTPLLDGGPILAIRRVAIGDEETTPELEPRLAEIGVSAVMESLELLARGGDTTQLGSPQDKSLVSKAPRLKKEDGLVDWSRTAEQIRNQVRAFKPWPTTYTFFAKEGEPQRLILDAVSVVSAEQAVGVSSGAPGTIVRGDTKHLWVQTGGGLLALDRVQPANKRAMAIAEFLAGHRLPAGERLGSATA